MKTVLVFKTSVRQEEDIRKLQTVLDRNISNNESWNFDLEDCDKILRVESWSTTADTISLALRSKGYHCQELED